MNKILLFSIFLLSLVRYSLQDCCYVVDGPRGDGERLYNVDITVRPAAQQVSLKCNDDYKIEAYEKDACTPQDDILYCNGTSDLGYFTTRLSMVDMYDETKIINEVNMEVHANGKRCDRSDSCNDDGTVNSQNKDEYCLSFLGCYPKLACYIAIGVFVVIILGIIIVIIRRNTGSAERAALDRPNTKVAHLDSRPEPINKYNSNSYNNNYNSSYSSKNNSNNTKETLIQIEEMPLDIKEAGTTKWVNKKYNSPSNQNSDLGLGLGSGGFGSTSSLLPQTSNINVINDPAAGLNRGRSIKRTQSTKSTKSMKKRTNESSHLNQPLLPTPPPPVHNPTSNLSRSKSARSTRSVKSSKSTRKPRISEIPAGAVNALATRSKSMRSQPKRYQIPSDSESESDSDSDNEVLGLRATSMKRSNGSSQNKRSLSVRHKTTRY